MYLNHEYMCPWLANTLLPKLPYFVRFPALANFTGVVLLTIVSASIALVTFCCVEHPFLKIRAIILEKDKNNTPPAVSHLVKR